MQADKQQKVKGGKSDVSEVSRITTSGEKTKHCRECKKITGASHWARHVKICHTDGTPGFDFCKGGDCLFCKGKYLAIWKLAIWGFAIWDLEIWDLAIWTSCQVNSNANFYMCRHSGQDY